jgi:hypothetical protein
MASIPCSSRSEVSPGPVGRAHREVWRRTAGQAEEDDPDASTRARRLAATDDLEVSKASCRLAS